MQEKKVKKVVVLATGGTIAGLAGDVSKPHQYVSGLLKVNELTDQLDLHGAHLVQEQIANMDSKDMSFELWQSLLRRCDFWLSQSDVSGVVVTHGTDTLEETAYLLQRVLAPTKPLAMTCAMFPANVPESDGPKNLQDALNWVLSPPKMGVVVVCAGNVHPAIGVQKIYSDRTHAFASRKDAPETPTDCHVPSDWPMFLLDQVLQTAQWPRVDIVLNHAGADGQMVRAWTQARVRDSQPDSSLHSVVAGHPTGSVPDGLIAAGTGSGTLAKDLEGALLEAQQAGVRVARVSRCAFGVTDPDKHPGIASFGNLSAVQARVEMLLRLIANH